MVDSVLNSIEWHCRVRALEENKKIDLFLKFVWLEIGDVNVLIAWRHCLVQLSFLLANAFLIQCINK